MEVVEAPELPVLEGMVTYYGVQIAIVGDDGTQVVALGHVEPRRALAALNRLHRADLGWRLADEGFADVDSGEGVLAQFEHAWGRLKTVCAEYPVCAGEDEARPCVGCRQVAAYDWWIDTSDTLTEDTPGVFPVTIASL